MERVGNMPPQTGMLPDHLAPILRNFRDQRELTRLRWDMPSTSLALFEAAKESGQKLEQKRGSPLSKEEFDELLKHEPDGGTTDVRNKASKHWQRWLAPNVAASCPFTSFSEFNRTEGGGIWFAFDDTRPLEVEIWMTAPWEEVRASPPWSLATMADGDVPHDGDAGRPASRTFAPRLSRSD